VFSRNIVLSRQRLPPIPARRRGIGNHGYRHNPGSATRSDKRVAAVGGSSSDGRSVSLRTAASSAFAREHQAVILDRVSRMAVARSLKASGCPLMLMFETGQTEKNSL